MIKNTAARDQAMSSIRASLDKADARFAKTRDTLNAPLVSNSVADPSMPLSYTQATQLSHVMQGIKASAALQARVNEQIEAFNLPFPILKMAELAVFNETVLNALAQYRRHLHTMLRVRLKKSEKAV